MGNRPAPATVITRREQPVTWVNGNKQVIPLSRNLFSRGVILELTATPTLTGVNNTVANTQLGDEWAVVSKLEIFVNSATLLFSCAGADLKRLLSIMYGHRPRIQQNLGDGSTANPVLDSTVYIPYLNPRSRRPFDTLLAAPQFTDYRLEVTWATEATPGTAINSAATAYTTNPNLNVWQRVQSAPVDANGNVLMPQFFRRMLKTPVVFAGANQDFPKQLNTGPIYRGLVLNQQNAGGTADSTGILTNVRVDNGATVYKDIAFQVEQQWSQFNWDIFEEEFAASTGIWTQSNGAVNSKQLPQAWTFVDFCEDGYMSEAIDTQSVGDTFVHFNVNAATTVNMFTQELIRANY